MFKVETEEFDRRKKHHVSRDADPARRFDLKRGG
jgi:hypothetical protein